jgi:type I restriction enzyme R subunit
MTGFTEAQWELLALAALGEHGWKPLTGTDIAPGSDDRQALAELVSPKSQDAIAENHRIHQAIVDGYRGISYLDPDGVEHNPTIRLVSHEPSENDWLAVSQVTIRSREHDRRFDVVLYLNGLVIDQMETMASRYAA